MPGVFVTKPVGSWVAIGTAVLLAIICWVAFFCFVEPGLDFLGNPRIEADSTTYFRLAGVLPSGADLESSGLVTFGGNLLGPVLIARVLRDPFWIVPFNFLALALMVHIAGLIPGVRRRYFLILFLLNAESLVSIATLNKEILASVGVVAFIAAVMVKTHRKRFLAIAVIFSIMARWEQLAILLLYGALECRFSPFRRKHKLALGFILATLTVAYVAILRYSGIDLAGFLASADSAGLVARLDNVQARFGLPLVIVPKAFMNLFNRMLSPGFFFTSGYWSSDFNELQGTVIIHLHSLAMLALAIAAFLKKRLSPSHPIAFLIYLYVMITAVSPFIQPRYEFPVYTLLCLQMSISPEFFPKRIRKPVKVRQTAPLAAYLDAQYK